MTEAAENGWVKTGTFAFRADQVAYVQSQQIGTKVVLKSGVILVVLTRVNNLIALIDLALTQSKPQESKSD